MESQGDANIRGSTHRRSRVELIPIADIPQMSKEKKYKIYKTLVFISCLLGFIIHFTIFMVIYLKYSTTLEVFVKQVDIKDLPKPMLTVCDLNGLRRTAFCKDRSYCGLIPNFDEIKFCEKYKYYCAIKNYSREDNFLIPFANAMAKADYNRKRVEMFGTRAEDILKLYKNNTTEIIFPNEIQKPRRCYTLNLEHAFKYKFRISFNFEFVEMLGTNEIAQIMLNFNLNEIFHILETPRARVAIHSKDQIVNPFINGFMVEPGKKYHIQLKAIEHNLLPSPYSTNCINYKVTKEKSFNETINQDRCVIECVRENWEKKCGCISNSYPFYYEGEFCTKVDCIINVNNDECYRKCRSSCKFTVFEYEVNESPNEFYNFLYPDKLGKEYSHLKHKDWLTEINFLYKRAELLVYNYKAQYEMIELFGYVGGYIGVWIGISLFIVFKLLEIIIISLYNKCNREEYVNHKNNSNRSTNNVTEF